MQHGTAHSSAADFSDLVARLHSIIFLYEDTAIVCVSTQILPVVIDDHKVTVPEKTTACIDHATGRSSINRISSTA